MLTFRHWPGPLLVLVLLLVTLDTPAALEYVGRVSGGGLQHLACIPAHSAQQTNLTLTHRVQCTYASGTHSLFWWGTQWGCSCACSNNPLVQTHVPAFTQGQASPITSEALSIEWRMEAIAHIASLVIKHTYCKVRREVHTCVLLLLLLLMVAACHVNIIVHVSGRERGAALLLFPATSFP
jgi:hypothetical protein